MHVDYVPSRSLPAKVLRRVRQWRRAAPAHAHPDRPVVSFTFDDFPKSAVRGADIVEKLGGRAGFYASTCYLGQTHPTLGEMFDAQTLHDLRDRGHEIGAHSHGHVDLAKVDMKKLEHEVAANLTALTDAGYQDVVTSFAFPYGETSFSAKEWSAEIFATARGITPGLNVGDIDRAQLFAVELGEDEHRKARAIRMIETAAASNAWLIFFTHDVSDDPSPYGVSYSLLRELAQRAVDSGCVLATPTLGAVLSGVID